MPFGLHGAPAILQRLIYQVIQECSALHILMMWWSSALHSAGLTLNMQKWSWAKNEVHYLGYHLGNGEIHPQVDKVEAIRDSPRP